MRYFVWRIYFYNTTEHRLFARVCCLLYLLISARTVSYLSKLICVKALTFILVERGRCTTLMSDVKAEFSAFSDLWCLYSNWPARQYASYLRVFNAKPLCLTEYKAITIPEQQRKTHHWPELHILISMESVNFYIYK